MPEPRHQEIPKTIPLIGPENIKEDLTFIKSSIMEALGIKISRHPEFVIPDAIDVAKALDIRLSKSIEENYRLSQAQMRLFERHCSPQVIFNEPPVYDEVAQFVAYEQMGVCVINAGVAGRILMASIDPGPVPKYTTAKTEAWLERWHRR